jgi:hypothetical protein
MKQNLAGFFYKTSGRAITVALLNFLLPGAGYLELEPLWSGRKAIFSRFSLWVLIASCISLIGDMKEYWGVNPPAGSFLEALGWPSWKLAILSFLLNPHLVAFRLAFAVDAGRLAVEKESNEQTKPGPREDEGKDLVNQTKTETTTHYKEGEP